MLTGLFIQLMMIASLKMNSDWNRGWNRTNYTNKNSKGQDRLKKQAKAAAMGIYFFFAVLIACGIFIVLR
jgi:hypothetical protein